MHSVLWVLPIYFMMRTRLGPPSPTACLGFPARVRYVSALGSRTGNWDWGGAQACCMFFMQRSYRHITLVLVGTVGSVSKPAVNWSLVGAVVHTASGHLCVCYQVLQLLCWWHKLSAPGWSLCTDSKTLTRSCRRLCLA